MGMCDPPEVGPSNNTIIVTLHLFCIHYKNPYICTTFIRVYFFQLICFTICNTIDNNKNILFTEGKNYER